MKILWQKEKKKEKNKNIFLGLMIEKQQASLWFLALAQVPSSVPASPHLELEYFSYLL
jgi:hypothetical protein